MKKITLLFALVIISFWGFSQEFISEDFSGSFPPTDWTIDAHSANWSQNSTENAGGSAPEAKFYYNPSFNGVSRLISPVIDLSGINSVVFSFKHMLDNYDATQYELKAATTSDGGNTWNEIWSVNPSGDIPAETQLITITNSDVGSADFQVAIIFDGNSYNIDNWYIDDVLLFAPLDLDASMNDITMPTMIAEPTEVTGSFTNMGNQTIYDFNINWQVDGGEIFTTSYSGETVDPLGSFDFTCTDLFMAPIGSYTMNVWISDVNGGEDDNPDNNLASIMISIPSFVVSQKPAFEEFTSSTCAPCASFHNTFVPWCEDHTDEIVLVKYQMNWPGSGDIYYTEQGGVRRNYYGVTWVPWLNLNGSTIGTNLAEVNAGFDEAITHNSTYKIASSFELVGSQITVNANILPFAGQEGMRVHMIVFENETTGNIGSNGETSFEHVMMRMIPDADGTQENFADRAPLGFTGTFDMSTTNVEELDDLSVAILVQHESSQEVLQAAYGIKDAVFATEDNLISLYYDNTEIPNFDPDELNYSVQLPEGTTTTPVISTGGAVDENATIVIVQPLNPNGTGTVDVFAEDLLTHKQYTINFSVVGIDENNTSNVNIYPNPTKDFVYITGVEDAEVEIVSLDGKVIKSIYINDNAKINLKGLEKGVYLLHIVSETTSVHKRIVIK